MLNSSTVTWTFAAPVPPSGTATAVTVLSPPRGAPFMAEPAVRTATVFADCRRGNGCTLLHTHAHAVTNLY